MKPRILIVDDDETAATSFSDYIHDSKEKAGQLLRIADFDIAIATTTAAATVLLADASRRRAPFDLMLLDLHLPVPGGGFELLELIQKDGTVGETVVVSGYLRALDEVQSENVLKSLQLGAADFIYKQYLTKRGFQETVLRSLQRTVARNSSNILEQRIKELVLFAERGLVYHFGMCFSRCIQEVGRAGGSIRGELRERLGLDHRYDQTDALLQELHEIDLSLARGRQEWCKLQASLGLSSLSSPETVEVQDMVTELQNDFERCFISKNASLFPESLPRMPVLSFNTDVRSVLGEMIIGGLVNLPEFGERPTHLILKAEPQGDWLEILLQDTLHPFSSDEATYINEGLGVGLDPQFGRAWGLSVMQYTASRGGGRLTVEPLDRGNKVKFRIPLARNG